MARAGRVVGLLQPALLDRGGQVEEGGNPAAARLDLLDPGDRGRRHQREPEPTVGAERLLRREVVDVGLAQVDLDRTGGRGGVGEQQRARVGARDPLHRHRDAGRGLVVRDAVRVHAGLGDQAAGGAGLGLADRGLAEERCLLGRLGELGAELAEGGELGPVADQAERGTVPERGGAAVGEDHLVPLGRREQLGEAAAQPGHLVAHRLLPVRRAEVGRGDARREPRRPPGGPCPARSRSGRRRA